MNRLFLKQLVKSRKTEKDAQNVFETEQKDKEIKEIVETIDNVAKVEEPLKQESDNLFIYRDDDLLKYGEITPVDKTFIPYIADRTHFNSNNQIFNSDEDT